MRTMGRGANALFYGVSVLALTSAGLQSAKAQTVQTLDEITVVATKTEEKAIDSLAPVSVVNQSTIQMINPSRLNQIFRTVPGVSFMDRGDSPENSINIRGMQDFGRVAVVVDGVRQNYQRTGHNANGSFFLDPELLAGVDIVRGPTANIYGSGAIGGVASFRTKDVDDILRPGEKWGTEVAGSAGSNAGRGMASGFTGVRVNPNLDVFLGATHRMQSNYKGGDGIEIANTANHASTGIAKVTVRPADGHEVKFGGIFQENLFNFGQFNRGAGTANQGTSVFASDVQNYQANARWRYSKPEDKIFNWDANVYWNRTINDQKKIYHYSTSSLNCPGSTGNNISGCVGNPRGYQLDTIGFDVHNTSRFDFGDWRHALTVGGDMFRDDVTTWDTPPGISNITTPGGLRTVSGAFVQLKTNYSSWLEIVSAARYDQYQLESVKANTDGNRVSPKITVGVTPFRGFTPYVSYAEGYRAPAITETLIAGAHATGGGPPPVTCDDGSQGMFCFLPNPNLRPEVGKTKEAGLNLQFNNIFFTNDSFRGKFNFFRNDVDDYIELTFFGPTTVYGSSLAQYMNIPKAHIQGFEAETMYDAGDWFLGISGQIQRGYNDVTNEGLINVQGDKLATTAGVRLLDRKLLLAASWISVASNQHVPSNYIPSSSYDLLNFYMTYQPVKDLWVNFSVDNALDRYYRPYAVPRAVSGGEQQNDVFWASVPPGIVYKASLRIHFSAM